MPNEDGDDGELMPIETDEEWDLVEEMLNTFLKRKKSKFEPAVKLWPVFFYDSITIC